jgi:hypothetical protein
VIDPLNGFDWNSLYSRYDRMCAQTLRFNPEVPTFDCFKPKPKSDRELYYFLLSRISDERKTGSLMFLPSYEAILYWKMYSTSPKINNDIKNRSDIRLQLQRALPQFHNYPIDLKQQRNEVTSLVRRTMKLGLYGMGLPVCTTVLHFLYPSIIPIFDQMILRAVGYDRDEIKRKRLNQSQDLYGDYLGFHWSLVEKYRSKINNFRETPVRVIEMALWISRG